MSTKKAAVKTATTKATATKKATASKAAKVVKAAEAKVKKVKEAFDYQALTDKVLSILSGLEKIGVSAGNVSARHNSIGLKLNGKGIATLYLKRRGVTIGNKEGTHKVLADKIKVLDSKFYPNYTYQWEDTVLVEDLEKAIKVLAETAKVVAPVKSENKPAKTKVAAAEKKTTEVTTSEASPKKRPLAKKPAKAQTLKAGKSQPKAKK